MAGAASGAAEAHVAEDINRQIVRIAQLCDQSAEAGQAGGRKSSQDLERMAEYLHSLAERLLQPLRSLGPLCGPLQQQGCSYKAIAISCGSSLVLQRSGPQSGPQLCGNSCSRQGGPHAPDPAASAAGARSTICLCPLIPALGSRTRRHPAAAPQ